MTILGDVFSAGEASQLGGVSWRVLDSWAKTGFLRPSIRQARGTGSRRTYSFADLVALAAVQHLRAAGVELGTLKPVVTYLQRRPDLERVPPGTLLLLEGGEVREERASRGLEREWFPAGREARSGEAGVWLLFDLSGVVQKIVQQVEAHRAADAAGRAEPNDWPRRGRVAGEERDVTRSGTAV